MAKRASILALEDEVYRVEVIREWFAPHVVYATDFVPDFVAQVARGDWRLILMDHDLDPDPSAPNGRDAAERIGRADGPAFAASCYVPVVVHSLNLEQAGSIVSALWSWEAPVVRIPFHQLSVYIDWIRQLVG